MICRSITGKNRVTPQDTMNTHCNSHANDSYGAVIWAERIEHTTCKDWLACLSVVNEEALLGLTPSPSGLIFRVCTFQHIARLCVQWFSTWSTSQNGLSSNPARSLLSLFPYNPNKTSKLDRCDFYLESTFGWYSFSASSTSFLSNVGSRQIALGWVVESILWLLVSGSMDKRVVLLRIS